MAQAKHVNIAIRVLITAAGRNHPRIRGGSRRDSPIHGAFLLIPLDRS